MRLKAVLTVLVILVLLQPGCRPAAPRSVSFIDKAGRFRIRLKPTQAAHSFSEGLAAVSLDKKWGFIDSKGQFVIPPQFGWVGDFSDGLAVVTSTPESDFWNKETLFGFIDKSGLYVLPEEFNWAGSFTEGLAPVCVGKCRNAEFRQRHAGYIDHLGHYVLPPQFVDADNFAEGLASVSTTGVLGSPSHGFIDRAGRFVIAPRFIFASTFSHGLAATDKGYVDHHGTVVINRQPAANQGGDFSQGWAVVQEGDELVFIDTAGQVKLRPHLQSVGSFSENLAPACRSNCEPSALGSGQNWGYIDRSGKFVIKPELGYRPEPFKNGLALVCLGCKG